MVEAFPFAPSQQVHSQQDASGNQQDHLNRATIHPFLLLPFPVGGGNGQNTTSVNILQSLEKITPFLEKWQSSQTKGEETAQIPARWGRR
jgi:hypothetical protein